MKLLAIAFLAGMIVAAVPATAQLPIGAITLSADSIPPNVSTSVTVTASIPDPSLNRASLIRLDANGNVLASLGILQNQGNGVYTIAVNFNEAPGTRINLQISALFAVPVPPEPRRPLVKWVTQTSGVVSIDVGSPVRLAITANESPLPNAAGWNNKNVLVSFRCSGGTGAVTCPAATLVATEGAAQVITGTVTDGAGDTASQSVTVNLDETPPVLSVSAPADDALVESNPLTVTGTASDALSGVAAVTCNGQTATVNGSAFSCQVNLVPGQNGVLIAATDVAGNVESAVRTVTRVGAIQITTIATPAPNAAGWNNSNVTVTFTCSGGLEP
jgi:hypothetical protein